MSNKINLANTIMIDPGENKRKAIVVNVEAVEGLEKAWADYARENDLAILPCRGDAVLDGAWQELCKQVHHAFAYGLMCNDMTHGEVIEDISFALDKFAKEHGLPGHDWDTEYEDMYGGE